LSWYYQIFGAIARPLGLLLSFLYDHIGAYGITLIVFTLIVRGCLFPLYASQIKGQMRMMDIQPKMQALQKKYANDRQQLGMKMQELYKAEGYNPMMGCLPLLIQMPILMGLFVLLRNPIAYIPGDSAMLLGTPEGVGVDIMPVMDIEANVVIPVTIGRIHESGWLRSCIHQNPSCVPSSIAESPGI